MGRASDQGTESKSIGESGMIETEGQPLLIGGHFNVQDGVVIHA
jgi:hypothetical protein